VTKENKKSGEAIDRRFSRRNFLRLLVGAGAGAATLWTVGAKTAARRRRAVKLPKVSVRESCVVCTGCLAVCPKDAIALRPGRIVVDNERCISCGYCAAACPVGALTVNRESHDA